MASSGREDRLSTWILLMTSQTSARAKLGSTNSKKEFRVSLAWETLRSTAEAEPRRRTRSIGDEPDIPATPRKKKRRLYYVNKGFSLPESRFLPGDHFPEYS